MFCVRILVLFAIVAVNSTKVFAESPSENKQSDVNAELSVLNKKLCAELGYSIELSGPDKNIVIKISEDKEATLGYVIAPTTMTRKIDLVESSCIEEKVKLPNCSIIIPMHIYFYGFVWTKHPDTTKIGQKIKSSEEKEGASFFQTFNSDVGFIDPLRNSALKLESISMPRLQCDHFDWLGNLKTQDEIVMSNFYTEGLNEIPGLEGLYNQVEEGILNSKLKRTSNTEYEFSEFGSAYSRDDDVPSIPITGNLGFVFDISNGNSCEVRAVMESNLTPLFNLIANLYEEAKNKKNINLTAFSKQYQALMDNNGDRQTKSNPNLLSDDDIEEIGQSLNLFQVIERVSDDNGNATDYRFENIKRIKD